MCSPLVAHLPSADVDDSSVVGRNGNLAPHPLSFTGGGVIAQLLASTTPDVPASFVPVAQGAVRPSTPAGWSTAYVYGPDEAGVWAEQVGDGVAKTITRVGTVDATDPAVRWM